MAAQAFVAQQLAMACLPARGHLSHRLRFGKTGESAGKDRTKGGGGGEPSGHSAAVKWGLIGFLSWLSLRRVGLLFALAPADVAALAAAASLLPPLHVILFYAVTKLLALVLGPVLMRGRPVWPFMPVVSMATLAILALGWLSWTLQPKR